jgi:hypothetical protein
MSGGLRDVDEGVGVYNNGVERDDNDRREDTNSEGPTSRLAYA